MNCISKWKIRFNYQSCIMYIVLIPFLRPTGFDECSRTYKFCFTIFLYCAVITAVLLFLYAIARRMFFEKVVYVIAVYYILLILITFAVQGKVSEGLQKLFATPALCIICLIFLKWNRSCFLQCIANILIVVLSMNVILCCPLFRQRVEEMGPHWMFIGHVQMASQLGLIGIYVSILAYKVGCMKRGKRNWLMSVSVATMALSFTAASLAALLILVYSSVYCRCNRRTKLFSLNSGIYFVAYLIANMAMMVFLWKQNWRVSISWLAAGTSGREFIWEAAFDAIKKKVWFGYGAYGYLIKVFWSQWTNNGIGMNYAHNEIVQKLLDGGIILLAAFIIMMCFYVNNVKKTKCLYLARLTNICLLSFLAVMTFESVMDFNYIYIFLSILIKLPQFGEDAIMHSYSLKKEDTRRVYSQCAQKDS